MKTLPKIGRAAPAIMLALGVGLRAGCASVPLLAFIRATASDPGRPSVPAKVYVESRSVANFERKITREFAERYGARSREKLDERFAALLAAGDLWARREAARIEAHARLAATVSALLAAQGYTMTTYEEAHYVVSFTLVETPWEELPVDGWITDDFPEGPRHEARLFIQVLRAPYTPEQSRSPLWRGVLYAEDAVAPKAYFKTLLQYLGRNFTGDTRMITD